MIIAYHCSDQFAQMVGVSMVSLLKNNIDASEITIYIIEHDITCENRSILKKIVADYNRELIFIPMPDINKSENLGLRKVKKKWIFDSYCRIFLDVILPSDVERVLYLDGDVMIVDSLHDLWETDMNECCCAGVLDCFNEKYYSYFSFTQTAKYCNSGVILFDLNLWKQKNINKRIKEYIKSQNSYIYFMEQTVWNVVLQDEIYILDPKYNVSTMMQYLTYQELELLRKPSRFYSENEIQSANKNPVIIHMTSSFLIRNRPWIENTNHPYKFVFLQYRDLTPWKDEMLIKDCRSKTQKILDVIIKIVPKKLMLIIASFLYNNIRIKKMKLIRFINQIS